MAPALEFAVAVEIVVLPAKVTGVAAAPRVTTPPALMLPINCTEDWVAALKLPPIFAAPELLKVRAPVFLKLAFEPTVKLLVLAELFVPKVYLNQTLSWPSGSEDHTHLACELLITGPQGPMEYSPITVAFDHAESLYAVVPQFAVPVGFDVVTFQLASVPA